MIKTRLVQALELVLLCLVAAGLAATLALLLTGCTPAQQAKATSATVTGVRIAACVQSVLAEEEQRRALQHRLAEVEAEQEAERLRQAEIDSLTRDGGTAQ
jgi:hypothetical protein